MRPWIMRPIVWVGVFVAVIAARDLSDGLMVLDALLYIALAALAVTVVVQAFRWGSRPIRWLAAVCGTVAFGGAIYLSRLPDDYNGIGDIGLIMLSFVGLAVAAWSSQPGGPLKREHFSRS